MTIHCPSGHPVEVPPANVQVSTKIVGDLMHVCGRCDGVFVHHSDGSVEPFTTPPVETTISRLPVP